MAYLSFINTIVVEDKPENSNARGLASMIAQGSVRKLSQNSFFEAKSISIIHLSSHEHLLLVQTHLVRFGPTGTWCYSADARTSTKTSLAQPRQPPHHTEFSFFSLHLILPNPYR
jgi:hypothetical protein